MKLWNWLNGRKVLIGAVCFWVANAMTSAVFPHYNPVPEWLKITQDILLWAGGVLTPVGIGHKLYKIIPPPATK